jgi:hypothetical protein
MNKIVLLAVTIVLMAGSVQARGYGGGGYHIFGGAHYYGGGGWGYRGWVAPLLFGGVLGYAASRPAVVYDESPTIIYTTAPQTMVIQSSNSSTSVVQETNAVSDDTSGYEERWVYFEDCKCERKVLVNTRQ